MNSESLRIIRIDNEYEANFAKKFMKRIIIVAYNEDDFAFGISQDLIFIIPKKYLNIIDEIFSDKEIIKLISKPLPAINQQITLSCNNCCNIIEYYNQNIRLSNQLKNNILKAQSLVEIVLLMLNYKIINENNREDFHIKPVFNEDRNNYLTYLTLFNDILIRNGPLLFADLINETRNYLSLNNPNLLNNKKLNPEIALQGLIFTDALRNDTATTLVWIPDY